LLNVLKETKKFENSVHGYYKLVTGNPIPIDGHYRDDPK